MMKEYFNSFASENGSRFRIQDLGFKIQDSGFKIQDLRLFLRLLRTNAFNPKS